MDWCQVRRAMTADPVVEKRLSASELSEPSVGRSNEVEEKRAIPRSNAASIGCIISKILCPARVGATMELRKATCFLRLVCLVGQCPAISRSSALNLIEILAVSLRFNANFGVRRSLLHI